MLRNDCGKLMVYTSTTVPHKKRFQSVRTATEKTAKLLKMGFEVVKFQKRFSQTYVYYENGEGEPVPIYCDNGKTSDLQEICSTLRNMMFVLSFHPKNSALRQQRKGLMRLS